MIYAVMFIYWAQWVALLHHSKKGSGFDSPARRPASSVRRHAGRPIGGDKLPLGVSVYVCVSLCDGLATCPGCFLPCVQKASIM